jgi:hypothetical protein
MTMDMTQASQMLKWLDEERRKDKTLITTLQERVETQAERITRLEEQLGSLRETASTLAVLPSRINELVQGSEKLRLELVNMIEQRDEQGRKEHREMERSRQLEVGAIRDEMAHLAEETRLVQRLSERVEVVATENSRLNEMAQRLDGAVTESGKRLEDRLQAVTYLEEQRRADHQRVVAVEKEGPEVRKRVEALAAKVLLLEDAVPKMRTRLEEGLKPIKEFEGVVEELRVADFRRNQDVRKWLGQAEEVREEMERIRDERQQLHVVQRDAQEVMRRMETFREALDVRQNETTERQRMLEERIKRQWEEWQSKEEKSRHNWEIEEEQRWREQRQSNERHQRQVEALVPELKLHGDQLNALWEARRVDASRLLEVAQDDYEAICTEADGCLAALREVSEGKEGA